MVEPVHLIMPSACPPSLALPLASQRKRSDEKKEHDRFIFNTLSTLLHQGKVCTPYDLTR